MIWGEEKWHCWHRVEHALHFLDGRPVSDAVELNYSHSVTAPFFETEFRQKFRHRQPEWLIRMHATIWQHYDKRLFELFDIRQSHTWEQYRKFLKEFYDIKGRSRAINPPMDKVC